MTLSEKLKGVKLPKQRSEPLWKGPQEDGITQSMLNAFLGCRERFRLRYVVGLQAAPRFNHRLAYGDMWHVCEETHARSGFVAMALDDYLAKLCKTYPLQQQEISKWGDICKVQFPCYADYWSRHKDVVKRKPLLEEQVFSVDYKLPSGRTVRLRGKWDSVDVVTKGDNAGIWLQENKTKSDPNEQQIQRQLTFDLQTMIYLVALRTYSHSNSLRDMARAAGAGNSVAIRGVRYNVVRRPRQYQGKKESRQEFMDRLYGIIMDKPGEFFMRWNVDITEQDITTFRRQFLDPILEQLCDWWEFIKFRDSVGVWTQEYCGLHWRHPFGCYNVLDEGGATELDEYLATGSTVGLVHAESLFNELA